MAESGIEGIDYDLLRGDTLAEAAHEEHFEEFGCWVAVLEVFQVVFFEGVEDTGFVAFVEWGLLP